VTTRTDIAGQGKANPVSLITSVAKLLEWLGARHNRDDLIQAAAAVSRALDDALAAPGTRTEDVGGTASTKACAQAIVDLLGRHAA
jgi:3-isopropylmalate dehydrogenase